MSHREVKPHPILEKDVRCFWTIEETQVDYNSKEIIPDPFAELIINCGAPFILETGDGSRLQLPRVFVSGVQTKPMNIKSTGPAQAIFVRMYPWGVQPIVGSQAANASILALDDKEWRDVATAVERSVRLHGYEEAIALLQEFVIGLYCRGHMEIASVRQAGRLLISTNGQMRMSEVAANCYLSPSQFERRFKQLTQISPKMYARIIRFRAICERLMRDPSSPLIALAQDLGYTDQAHLTRDFKEFAHQTPTEYAAYVRATAHLWQDAEFLQYS